MTLKEELEILRGEPVSVFDGDPMDIPCIETSDAEKLCKHPLVSVDMLTYNHEPYIRRAIEGVMMQQTDFEFELVIGEDCSQDKTREICFECQKKHPDRIRVLWWHENVLKLGGNGRRVRARCRGEFIAFCEGDDYWIDPLKLQKQVDFLRETGSSLCVANSEWHYPDGKTENHIFKTEKSLLEIGDFLDHYFHTSTYLLDRKAFEECRKAFPEILFWQDAVVTHCMAVTGKTCFIPDVVSVYNWTGTGVGGFYGTPKRDILLMQQFVQFSHCHAKVVSDHYFGLAMTLASGCLKACSASGFRHSLSARIRIARVAWDLCLMRKQRWRGCAFLIGACCLTPLVWLKIQVLKHPRIANKARALVRGFRQRHSRAPR